MHVCGLIGIFGEVHAPAKNGLRTIILSLINIIFSSGNVKLFRGLSAQTLVESSMMGDTFLEKIRRRIIGLNLRKKEEP